MPVPIFHSYGFGAAFLPGLLAGVEADPVNPMFVFRELSSRLPANAIVTADYAAAMRFLREVDSSSVIPPARSTRSGAITRRSARCTPTPWSAGFAASTAAQSSAVNAGSGAGVGSGRDPTPSTAPLYGQ